MENSNKTYIIAEAGVNHNGDISIAKKLIEEAKKAGADCIKFQTFKAKQIVTQDSPKAAYQLEVTDKNESQFEMLKKLELDMSAYEALVAYCQELDIDFLSTPYNKEDVDFLLKFDVSAFKIASGQLTELPFIKYVAKTNKRVILSTGMGTLADVYNAVEAVRSTGNTDLIVLQCTTNYPSKIEDSNILAMQSIRDACKVHVGYSDHVANNYACFAAVALGAEVIEKHFTIDRNMEGPDHSSSLIPSEFKEMIDGIRNIELALGSGVKRPSDIEVKNSLGMKRGMVILEPIKKGTILTEEHIGFKRPLKGIPINMLEEVLGKKVANDMKEDESLGFDSVIW